MAETTEFVIVPHTHWDREWYQTFQQFRMRLVRAMDKVLEALETDPGFTHFMLDGQTIPLEDYLEVRPENAERLEKLTRAGRLQVGPWYLQPDEFLVAGESLIRNLQLGMRISESFGGAMRVGYAPDLFGHITQLPQILRGFGIDNAVFWRGVGPEIDCSEFRWAAPDGTSVLAIWLSDVGDDVTQYTDGFRGYSNGRNLPLQPDGLIVRLSLLEGSLRRRATTNALLLMNGSDHLEPEIGLPQAVAATNKRLKSQDKALTIGTLEQYIGAIKQANPALKTYVGEMRSSRYSHLLPGCLSTRMWIKQRNAECEAELIRWAEPMSAWAWLLGTPYPAGLLRVSWRHLLHNHPHDSICGSGIDQVHEEMRPRFDQSAQIAHTLVNEALHTIATQVDTQGAATSGIPIVVFNPGPGPRTDVVALDLEVPSEDIEIVTDAGTPVPCQVRRMWRKELLDQEVAKGLVLSLLPLMQVNEGRIEGYAVHDVRFSTEPGGTVERIDAIVSEQGEMDMDVLNATVDHIRATARKDQIVSFRVVAHEVPRADVVLLATDVPAMGARTFYARPRRTDSGVSALSSLTPLVVEPAAIENEFFRVEAHPASGTLNLYDKTTDVHYTGLNLFHDEGDVGDLYNYSPPRHDVVVSNPRSRPKIELVQSGPAQSTLRISMRYELPARCADNRQSRHYDMVDCPIVTEVSVSPGVRRVDIRTEVENLAQDHRLRVLFPAPFVADVSEAEGAFDVVRRPVRQPSPLPGELPWSAWPEMPVDTHPQKRFVDVSDGRVGLAVLNRGLPEYEVLPWPVNGGVAIALTLLRCVEWLSRGDLDTRHGPAGPMEHTPLAQCLGHHTFEYAIVPHAGTWHADTALPLVEGQGFEAPMRGHVTTIHDGKLPTQWSFLSVAPHSVLVSAVKRSEREDALIVRLYNPTERSLETEMRLLFAFREARMADLNDEELPDNAVDEHHLTSIDDQGVRLTLRGGEIATVLFRF